VAAGLLERLLDGAWPGRTWSVATALATAGVAILTLASREDAELSVSGIGLALLAGSSYAGYTVVAKRLLRAGHEPIGVMGASFGIAAVLLLPVLLVGNTAWLAEPGGMALALYLGLLPTAVAYVLFARGLDRLAASEVTTIVLVEPLTATVLGVLVLDERLGAVAGAGAALVLMGLAVLALSPRARAPSPVAAEAALDDAI
jgi:DME family drug/metabolite transporter